MKRKRKKKPSPLEEIRDLLKKIAEKQAATPYIPVHPLPYDYPRPWGRRRIGPYEVDPDIRWQSSVVSQCAP